jgi:hypothetical protein
MYPPKIKNSKILVLVLVALLTFIGIAFTAYQRLLAQDGDSKVFLPVIVSSGTNSRFYTDATYGYSLEVPDDWLVAPSPAKGIGGVTTLSDPSGQVKIEVGVEIYDRSESVTIEEWVTPNSNLVASLQYQETLNLIQGIGVAQVYSREGWSGKIVYIPFGRKVIFAQLIPADDKYDDIYMHVVNSIIYSSVSVASQSTAVNRLYPQAPLFTASQFSSTEVKFILPFSGKAKITQTGDGGQPTTAQVGIAKR